MIYTQSQITAIEHILYKKIVNLRKERNELHEQRIEEGIYVKTHLETVLSHKINVLVELQEELHNNSLGKIK